MYVNVFTYMEINMYMDLNKIIFDFVYTYIC